MKKILLIISLFLLSGCFSSTPVKEVDKYFTKYQTDPDSILNDMKDILDFSDFLYGQKEEYIKILKRNYQNLEYKIKDNTINANKAIVIVEIEVYDYYKAINDSLLYKDKYMDEFKDEDGNYSESIFIDYQIKKLNDVSSKIKYTLEIGLTKIDSKWYIDDLSKEDKEKINGIYKY